MRVPTCNTLKLDQALIIVSTQTFRTFMLEIKPKIDNHLMYAILQCRATNNTWINIQRHAL